MTRRNAIEQLLKSDRGTRVLKRLLDVFDDQLLGLDAKNQGAVVTLLISFWDQPESTPEAIHQALGKEA